MSKLDNSRTPAKARPTEFVSRLVGGSSSLEGTSGGVYPRRQDRRDKPGGSFNLSKDGRQPTSAIRHIDLRAEQHMDLGLGTAGEVDRQRDGRSEEVGRRTT